MNKDQKGFAPMLILVVVAIVAVAGYLLLTKNGKYTTPTTNQSYSTIQSDSDLNKAAIDLENTDTKQVDTELNQLSSDTSAF